jgi:hypothetical protein
MDIATEPDCFRQAKSPAVLAGLFALETSLNEFTPSARLPIQTPIRLGGSPF